MATTAEAQSVLCPVCNAQPGHPCTRPTDTGRLPVAWVHHSRAAQADSQSSDYYLTFGIEYYTEPHPTWPEVNPKGWVRIVAPDFEKARAIAIERFGLDWSMLVPTPHFNPKFFPAGELMVLP